LRSFALGPIELAAIEALNHVYVILGDMLPLERQDFTRPHAGEEGESHDELFAKIKHIQNGLDLRRPQNPAGSGSQPSGTCTETFL